jgi:hypothetical protein
MAMNHAKRRRKTIAAGKLIPRNGSGPLCTIWSISNAWSDTGQMDRPMTIETRVFRSAPVPTEMSRRTSTPTMSALARPSTIVQTMSMGLLSSSAVRAGARPD